MDMAFVNSSRIRVLDQYHVDTQLYGMFPRTTSSHGHEPCTIASCGHYLRGCFFVACVHLPSPYQYTVMVLVDMKVQGRHANAPHV